MVLKFYTDDIYMTLVPQRKEGIGMVIQMAAKWC